MRHETPGTLTDGAHEFEAALTLIERVCAPRPRFPLTESMIVSRGNKDDWNLLKDLHYKEATLPIGPRFWKLTLFGDTIGVIVTSNPKGLLKERHIVFPNLKPGSGETLSTNTYRYAYVNSNFRVVSRFVIDTMYRGIGAGYRMMNLVARMEGNTFMEIQSSMSKFNHFGQKAGFKFVKPLNSNKFDAGMKFFRLNFEANPQDFEAIVAEIEGKRPGERDKLIETCRSWYYRNSPQEKTGGNRDGRGAERVAAMDARMIVKQLQQIILSSPMYGIWTNPQPKVALPQGDAVDRLRRTGPVQAPALECRQWLKITRSAARAGARMSSRSSCGRPTAGEILSVPDPAWATCPGEARSPSTA